MKIFDSLNFQYKEIAKESIYSFAIKVTEIITVLLVSLILANYISKDEYGTYVVLERFSLLLTNLIIFGTDFHLIKIFSKSHQLKKNDIRELIIFKAGVIMFSSVIFIVCLIINMMFEIFNFQYFILFLFSCIPAAFTFLHSSLFIGKKKVWMGSLFRISIHRIIFVFLILIPLFFDKLNLLNISFVFLLSRIIGYIISRKSLINTFGEKIKFSFGSCKKIINNYLIGLPFFSIQITFIFTQQFLIYFIGLTNSLSQVAAFDISLKIAMVTTLPQLVLSRSLSTRISNYYQNNDHDSLKNMIFKTAKVLQIISFIISAIFLVFTNQLLEFWGDKYQDATLIVSSLIILQLFKSMFGGVDEILRFTGLDKYLFKISFYNLILLVILSIILNYFIPFYGIIIALFLSEIVFNLLKYKKARSERNIIIPIPLINWKF